MNYQDIIEVLEKNIKNAQKLERWVMYKLINPVVDYIFNDNKFTLYYEYHMPKTKEISQSLEIFL